METGINERERSLRCPGREPSGCGRSGVLPGDRSLTANGCLPGSGHGRGNGLWLSSSGGQRPWLPVGGKPCGTLDQGGGEGSVGAGPGGMRLAMPPPGGGRRSGPHPPAILRMDHGIPAADGPNPPVGRWGGRPGLGWGWRTAAGAVLEPPSWGRHRAGENVLARTFSRGHGAADVAGLPGLRGRPRPRGWHRSGNPRRRSGSDG